MSNKKTYKMFFTRNSENIIIKTYDTKNVNYYSLIKDERQKGNLQFIINCDRFLKSFTNIKTETAKIVSVELLEDDYVFSDEVDQLVSQGDIDKLIKKISFLNEFNDIDIQAVRLKGKLKENSFELIIQNNGVIISELSNNIFNLEDTSDPLRKLILSILGLKHGKK